MAWNQGERLLAKTADRSVLGCMNDMAFMCEAATDDPGGPASTDIGELNRARRNINSARVDMTTMDPPADHLIHPLARPGPFPARDAVHRTAADGARIVAKWIRS